MKSVQELLPHREPFLFIDEIVDLTEKSILAKRRVRSEEPHFAGHYPGSPIMPGVLLCETVLQAGCCLMAARFPDALQNGRVPVVTRMNNVKFRRIVRPGDELEVRAEHERSMLDAHFMKGSIHTKGAVVVTLEFACMVAKSEGNR